MPQGMIVVLAAAATADGSVDYGRTLWSAWSGLRLTVADAAMAGFIVALTVLAVLLWRSTGRLMKAATEQSKLATAAIKLAAAAFSSAHRPKIILREATTGPLLEGRPIGITLRFANVGESTGRIIGGAFRTVVIDRSHPRGLFHGGLENRNDLDRMISIGPGREEIVAYAGETPVWESRKFVTMAERIAPADVHFHGSFVYLDDMNVERRTAFWRVLRPASQRFVVLRTESELNYAD